MLTTIEAIRAHQFVGNAMSDAAAFDAIDAFARNRAHPLAVRAEALRIVMHKGMGLSGPDACDHWSDRELVDHFMLTI